MKQSVDSQALDDLLDEWEEHLEENATASIDDFINQRERKLDPALTEAFRSKAARLARMNLLVGSIAGDIAATEILSGGSNPLPSLAAGLEPVPGYKLVARLGGGGFGEVWKADGPGGFQVALKFVTNRGRTGELEERSLQVIKNVRHPNLLSVFGTWRVGDQLIIASELADRTLLDCLQAHQKDGGVGIPPEELLDYMAEAAKGLDHLNQPDANHANRIQHRDVKPHNLLLSGGSVKVGDYGLARSLQTEVASHTGGLTFAYAAPECFEGETSHHCDQYSLAITYCELRGGLLPFRGTPIDVMNGHLKQSPDLSMIPAVEQPIVQRALAKKPDERWPSCSDFVGALMELSKAAGVSERIVPRAKPAPPPVPPPAAVNDPGRSTHVAGDTDPAPVEHVPVPKVPVARSDRRLSRRPKQSSLGLWAIVGSVLVAAILLLGILTYAPNLIPPKPNEPLSGNNGQSPSDVNSKPGEGDDDAPEPDTPVQATQVMWEPGVSLNGYGTEFQDMPPGKHFLAGLELTRGKYGAGYKHAAVSSLSPFYLSANGDLIPSKTYGQKGDLTKRLMAPDGYAVGAIRLSYASSRLVGLQLQFVRVNGLRLDTSDSQWSEFYLRDNGTITTLGDARSPIVGIGGSYAKQELRKVQIAKLVELR